MTVSLKHAFNNAIADDPADALAGKTLPSHWNAEHNLTGTANALFGFSGAGTGIDLTGTSWDATNRALTITSIANPAASTLTLTGGTALTTSQPVLNMTQTWNGAGVTFTGIKINVTDTASADASPILDLQWGGFSGLRYQPKGGGGGLIITGLHNNTNPTISFMNGATDTVLSSQIVGEGAGLLTVFNSSVRSFSFSGMELHVPGLSGQIGFSNNDDTRNNLDTSSSRQSAGVWQFGTGGVNAAGSIALKNITAQSGYTQMAEMTAPSAPAADNVRIYAVDNGGGKTQLMALFSSGAAQQIAIQP